MTPDLSKDAILFLRDLVDRGKEAHGRASLKATELHDPGIWGWLEALEAAGFIRLPGWYARDGLPVTTPVYEGLLNPAHEVGLTREGVDFVEQSDSERSGPP